MKNTSKERKLSPENWSANHFDYLLNFARGRMPDEELARDVVQQTFMAAWKGKASFRGASKERTWLTTILRNKITDFYRARSRRPELVALSSMTDEDNEDSSWIEDRVTEPESGEPDMVAKRMEHLTNVIEAISQLPEDTAKALRMRALDGASVSEIAVAMGVSAGSVSTRICRARNHLRNEFKMAG